MTTTFDKVMAERWTVGRANSQEDYGKNFSAGLLVDGTQVGAFGDWDYGCASDPSNNLVVAEQDDVRARVAVLGKWALELVLANEWCAEDSTDTGKPMCPECFETDVSSTGAPGVHKPDCAWGTIVSEVKRLREGT